MGVVVGDCSATREHTESQWLFTTNELLADPALCCQPMYTYNQLAPVPA